MQHSSYDELLPLFTWAKKLEHPHMHRRRLLCSASAYTQAQPTMIPLVRCTTSGKQHDPKRADNHVILV